MTLRFGPSQGFFTDSAASILPNATAGNLCGFRSGTQLPDLAVCAVFVAICRATALPTERVLEGFCN